MVSFIVEGDVIRGLLVIYEVKEEIYDIEEELKVIGKAMIPIYGPILPLSGPITCMCGPKNRVWCIYTQDG